MKYIIFYDVDDKEGRGYALAATNKANYIFSALEKNGYDVEIISASLVSSKGYIKGSEMELSEHIKLIKLPAFKWGNKFQKTIALMWRFWGLFFYLMKNVKKNEEIIVYHSLGNITSVKWAKRLKKFKLILEVEEIYNDAMVSVERAREKEIRFIKTADKYIFPTEMLNAQFNKENKPHVIIHGTYKVEHDRNVSFNDGKIHVVYAGTLEPIKGGAVASVATALYLSEKYHVHILGFGNTEEIDNIKKVVLQTNEKSYATVSYDGVLSGEEYIQFLQKCHIGMSTQNPDANFNATSFPSKILSYMANGLRVVTIKIPAVETSEVGNDLYYYDKQEPEKIAEAIMSVDLNDGYDSRKKIAELDRKFREDLKELLG